MKRTDAFKTLENHPFLGKSFKRLSKLERASCLLFLNSNQALSSDEFESAVNRWWLDCSDKPKNWTIMMELVSSSKVTV